MKARVVLILFLLLSSCGSSSQKDKSIKEESSLTLEGEAFSIPRFEQYNNQNQSKSTKSTKKEKSAAAVTIDSLIEVTFSTNNQ